MEKIKYWGMPILHGLGILLIFNLLYWATNWDSPVLAALITFPFYIFVRAMIDLVVGLNRIRKANNERAWEWENAVVITEEAIERRREERRE